MAIPVSLYDTLVFEPTASSDLLLEVHGTTPDIPADGRNIAFRALEELRREAVVSYGGRLRIVKRIPSQAGLGGGSSDAAAALRLADRAWNLGLDGETLKHIAGRLGSDVPLFLPGGATLAEGRGEHVKTLVGPGPWHFVVLKPPEGLSTAEVYRICMDHHDGRLREVADFLEAWRFGRRKRFADTCFNRLEEPASVLWAGLEELRNVFRRVGCPVVRMSGSGTAVFGLCHDAVHARRTAGLLRRRGLGNVFAVHSLMKACRIEYEGSGNARTPKMEGPKVNDCGNFEDGERPGPVDFPAWPGVEPF